MKFFFADSHDLVDPRYDFVNESHPLDRVRQRDEVYAHELFSEPAYDGVLVSKGIVDGVGPGSNGKYTTAQRQRLLRVGAPEYFRAARPGGETLPLMGDCGAFTYVKDEEPPFTVDEVLYFYGECRFDYGIAIDHVIVAYQPDWDAGDDSEAATKAKARQDLTLQLAAEFLREHKRQRYRFEPLGVAQGWSPKSYAHAVRELQRIGYKYIAMGGMVPLKSPEILESLSAVRDVRRSDVRLHLLGVARPEHAKAFAAAGVASIDSTSPLRQAFKDDKDNYYTYDRNYTAVRVPQIQGNNRLRNKISSGQVSQDHARRLERDSLRLLREYDAGGCGIDEVVETVCEYERLLSPRAKHEEVYRELLEAAPWRDCPCDVCRHLGYEVVLFRGAERNRRRGFHNLWVFYRKLAIELDLVSAEAAVR